MCWPVVVLSDDRPLLPKKASKFSVSSWLLEFTIFYCVLLVVESKRRKWILFRRKITGDSLQRGWASFVSHQGFIMFLLWYLFFGAVIQDYVG